MGDNCKSYCRDCKRETNHSIVKEYQESGYVDEGDFKWWHDYQILKCQGCGAVSFRLIRSNDNDYERDGKTGEYEYARHIEVFPDDAKKRAVISGSDKFPALTKRVYRETLTAINANAPILAAVGIRAIIESICQNLKTNEPNLEKNIDALVTREYLSAMQAGMLHRLRFMGNMAAHEIKPPKPSDLTVALEITETLLKTIYVLPEMGAQLPRSKPKKLDIKRGIRKSGTSGV